MIEIKNSFEPLNYSIMEDQFIFNPDNLWFTSDTHFWHENIIRFCNRPFNTIEEMNEALVRNWNEVVPPEGTVFHLGDFSYGNAKKLNNILYRLNGKIILILGNHDWKMVRQGFMSRFEHITQQMTIRAGGQPVILNHYPFLTYGGAYRNVWQLFGHVHSGPRSDQGKDLVRLKNLFPRQYDVGVDNNHYRPISFTRVKEMIEKQIRETYQENV